MIRGIETRTPLELNDLSIYLDESSGEYFLSADYMFKDKDGKEHLITIPKIRTGFIQGATSESRIWIDIDEENTVQEILTGEKNLNKTTVAKSAQLDVNNAYYEIVPDKNNSLFYVLGEKNED